ncbi:MAG: hypothetical protein G3M78_14030 [Candidatus Nitrohelix vancouverensis]|uniref:Uncharacterized protein n=1 Tax=Candidatus Nitrohelix vancouverensis TaxID=2705534 RepID=A0A7T0G4K4_9BACT|nr:MAG: hypothetical protein G3M78_14030 [Candidatus Nitrohelix vancouverensis]
MQSFCYFMGRALQLLGLATITTVVFLFFTQMSMEPLLVWTIVGSVEFYLGTWALERGRK